MHVRSTTRLLLTGIASSNLHLKQLPMVQSSYLEENVVRISLTTERAYLRYLGKPVSEMDYVWGDNKNMINRSTIPEARLHKRHNILSFHFVRSMISLGYINLQHLSSE